MPLLPNAGKEELHPETKHGGNHGEDGKFSPARQNGDTSRFTADTAAKTGKSERSIQRDAERGAPKRWSRTNTVDLQPVLKVMGRAVAFGLDERGGGA